MDIKRDENLSNIGARLVQDTDDGFSSIFLRDCPIPVVLKSTYCINERQVANRGGYSQMTLGALAQGSQQLRGRDRRHSVDLTRSTDGFSFRSVRVTIGDLTSTILLPKILASPSDIVD